MWMAQIMTTWTRSIVYASHLKNKGDSSWKPKSILDGFSMTVEDFFNLTLLSTDVYINVEHTLVYWYTLFGST